MLYKKPGETIIPKEELARRCASFAKGEWQELLASSNQCMNPVQNRKLSSDEAKIIRSEALIGLGELSQARQALESLDLAPGDGNTLGKLCDPNKRPPLPRDVLPDHIRQFVPSEKFPLDPERFAKN